MLAVIQLNSTSVVERNVRTLVDLVRRAAAAGATLIATPEASTYLGPHTNKVKMAAPLHHQTHMQFGALAKELGVHLLLGGVVEQCDDSSAASSPNSAQKTYNTSILFSPEGELVASYRKMHLFDVDLSEDGGGGVKFKESDTTAGGEKLVVAETPLGKLGLSICYDLRFPEMYRKLVDQGAEMLAVPSAFTDATGKHHWEALLRARAIETQCWVLAPAQWGKHDDEGLRHSYGHSMIINPYGTVVAQCGEGVGFCLAPHDETLVKKIRARMPIASHRQLS